MRSMNTTQFDASGKTVFIGWTVRAVDPTGNAGVQTYRHVGHDAKTQLARTEEYLNTWGWAYEVKEIWVDRASNTFAGVR